jgi:hypothetical protein
MLLLSQYLCVAVYVQVHGSTVSQQLQEPDTRAVYALVCLQRTQISVVDLRAVNLETFCARVWVSCLQVMMC